MPGANPRRRRGSRGPGPSHRQQSSSSTSDYRSRNSRRSHLLRCTQSPSRRPAIHLPRPTTDTARWPETGTHGAPAWRTTRRGPRAPRPAAGPSPCWWVGHFALRVALLVKMTLPARHQGFLVIAPLPCSRWPSVNARAAQSLRWLRSSLTGIRWTGVSLRQVPRSARLAAVVRFECKSITSV